ncbi:MAG: F0F1 ATP synthase subunit epsilon [Ruminococcaceae bacterium]|jgi:F-type H+-transporting ATPase subunit epsilon|nr:F0F1 ATP synthase subunit epsilon [Oscillospiraceae bacterium]
MANPFHLRICAMDRAFYDGGCLSLTLPLPDGQLGILAGHAPMAAAVVPGKLTARLADGTVLTAVTGHGVARFEKNDALVLLESIERPEEIEEKRAAERLEQAKEALRLSKTEQQRRIASDMVAHELNRVRRAKEPK